MTTCLVLVTCWHTFIVSCSLSSTYSKSYTQTTVTWWQCISIKECLQQLGVIIFFEEKTIFFNIKYIFFVFVNRWSHKALISLTLKLEVESNVHLKKKCKCIIIAGMKISKNKIPEMKVVGLIGSWYMMVGFDCWGSTSMWAFDREVFDQCPLTLKYSSHLWGPKNFSRGEKLKRMYY